MSNAPDLGSNLDDDSTLIPKMEPAVIATAQEAKRKIDRLAQYKKRVWIVLEDNDNIPPTGQFFGHNGNGFMLRPGVPAEVPVELVDILNHAIYSAPQVDSQTRQIIGYTQRLRFPYRMIPAPQKEAA